MGKNSDTKNIFDNYFNNVLLKEAVKATEEEGGSPLNLNTQAIDAILGSKDVPEETRKKLEELKASQESGKPAENKATTDTPASTQPAAPKTRAEAIDQEKNRRGPNKVNQPPKVDLKAKYDEEYTKKFGKPPGFANPDSFANIDKYPVNSQSNPEMAEFKKQLLSGQVPAQAASPATTQPEASSSQGGISVAMPGSNPITIGGGGTSVPATASAPTTTTTQSNTAPPLTNQPITVRDNEGKDVTFTSQPTTSTTTDDFQKKMDAQFAEFQKSKPAAATQAAAPQQAATQSASTPAKTASSGSIVDYLAGSGQASDFASRSKMAAQYGIQNYKGTAEQNTQLLNKLKSGEKPTQQAATTTQTQPQKQQGMGGAVGGVSKAIGSAGQGLKQATIGTKKPLGGALGLASKGLASLGKGIKTALVGNQEQEENNEEEKSEEKDENCEDCGLNKITVQEKINISKFLMRLSEKNYSSAHKYLKAILNSKINKIVSERIDKI